MQFIYVVRHGETDANVKGQINDRNMNTQLNKNGIKQATKTGKYFKKYRCDTKNCTIYSSPSIRAVQTAVLIGKQLKNNSIIKDDRLYECDYGLLSGKAPCDKIFQEQTKFWNIYDKKYKYPIENAIQEDKQIEKLKKKYKIENYPDRIKRVKSFFKSLPKNQKSIIIATHGSIIQVIIDTLFNIATNNSILGDLKNGKNCTITCILRNGNNYKLLTTPNTKHLGL